jgi:hypothetical protein
VQLEELLRARRSRATIVRLPRCSRITVLIVSRSTNSRPVAINWLLQRPTVANVERLDAASATPLTYPYWHQRWFAERNPPPWQG